MKKSALLAVAGFAAALVLPVVASAPRPEPALPDSRMPDHLMADNEMTDDQMSDGRTPERQVVDGGSTPLRTVDDVVDACRASGLQGWPLVDLATSLVHRMYTRYSCWHLWLSPARSLAAGQGCSTQYNLALAQILRRLGLSVHVVHASRVRMEHHPWFHTGHTWLQVVCEGRRLDVCASRPGNRAGEVAFVPITEVRPFRRLTHLDTTLALAPIVVAGWWRSRLQRRPVPRWMYRPFGQSA